MFRKYLAVAALTLMSTAASAASLLPGVTVPTSSGVALISSLAPGGVPSALAFPALTLVGMGFASYSPVLALGIGAAGPALGPALSAPLPGLGDLP